jgi:hypothetical protein
VPDVTVVLATTVAHELHRMALLDTLAQIAPAEVLIWTDRPAFFPDTFAGASGDQEIVLGIEIPAIKSIADWYRVVWYEVPIAIATSHFLVIQWDGWVLDGQRWSDDWLQYDYIGAVWPWHMQHRVGNGGFRLTSTRLARFLSTHRAEYPIRWPDDDLICRVYRGALEHTHGFRWAPESEALKFSIEHGDLTPEGTFGFHDCRNLPRLLSTPRLTRRIDAADEFTRTKQEFQKMLIGAAGTR